MSSNAWLIVESPNHWKVDSNNSFAYFGVTKRFEYLKNQIKKGDRLFTYVTTKSAFADVREVTKDGLRNLRGGGDYEIALPFCVDTKPWLTLPEEHWVSISEVREQLVLTAGRRQHWSHVFRMAFRRLDPADAALLEHKLQARIVDCSS